MYKELTYSLATVRPAVVVLSQSIFYHDMPFSDEGDDLLFGHYYNCNCSFVHCSCSFVSVDMPFFNVDGR